jgi:hypothetical protein
MDTTLIASLHSEERMILAELRGSIHYRRLEEIRKLLGLYTGQPRIEHTDEPPIGAFLDAMLGDPGPRHSGRPPHHSDVIALHGERAIA